MARREETSLSPALATRLSLAAGVLIFGIKYVAWAMTGSVALYSDALESIANIVAALGTVFAVSVSLMPADRGHPFGHSKAEYFSSALEGLLILGASVLIVREAWHRLVAVQALGAIGGGMILSAGASALNGAVALVLARTGKRHRSPALLADSAHLWTDVVTSLGVLAGVGAAWATGWWLLDPLLAIAVALHIVWVGGKLVAGSISGLMDAAVPELELERIRAIIRAHMGGALEAHDVRTRKAGPRTFIQFHLIVPHEMTVGDSHAICDRIEAALERELPGSEVTVHVEPEELAEHTDESVEP